MSESCSHSVSVLALKRVSPVGNCTVACAPAVAPLIEPSWK
jgi:hypothetical protein